MTDPMIEQIDLDEESLAAHWMRMEITTESMRHCGRMQEIAYEYAVRLAEEQKAETQR